MYDADGFNFYMKWIANFSLKTFQQKSIFINIEIISCLNVDIKLLKPASHPNKNNIRVYFMT